MKDYLWFRLFVRAIGLLLMGLGLPSMMLSGNRVFEWISQLSLGASPVQWLGFALYALAIVVQPALGAYLYFGGNAVIKYCLRDIGSRCPGCGYNLSGAKHERCPECGLPVTPSTSTATPDASKASPSAD